MVQPSRNSDPRFNCRVRGKRGHLYFDDGALSAMWIGAPPTNRTRLEGLRETFWQGDIGRDANGRRVQDVWVRGIRSEAYRLAI